MDVAYLSWDQKAGTSVFEYTSSFLERTLDIAPLTMSINSSRSLKHIPWTGEKDKLYRGLPPMLADSLPDQWGDSLFMAWLRDNNISTKKINPIDHLSFIGSRAMGALEYEPARRLGSDSVFSVDVQNLYKFAKQVLNTRESTVLNKENSILWQDLMKISSSPGGKRPKAIIALNETSGEVISGQGVVPEGFKHYILKYDDNSAYPFAKLEYIYYQMAMDAGIEMMPSMLRTYGNVTHFLTQRFDRIGNDKIHTQTLAAMSPISNRYEDIFTVIRQLKLPYKDYEQQYLRTVFNVVARNVDDHSKNFAFCMGADGVWRLSPAYDLTYSVDPAAPNYMNRHSLTLNGKNEDITRNDIETLGLDNDIQDCKTLLDKVVSVVNNFEKYAKDFDIDKSLLNSIKRELLADI